MTGEPQAPSNPVRVAQEHLRVFLDLAISADTAEIMMRPYYPGEAASLHAKVKAAKEILDVSVCKTCWGHGWIDDDKGGHTCADCAAPVPRLSEDSREPLREALDNSQSLLAMLLHLGEGGRAVAGRIPSGITEPEWNSEGLTKLLTEQIAENRAALSAGAGASPRSEDWLREAITYAIIDNIAVNDGLEAAVAAIMTTLALSRPAGASVGKPNDLADRCPTCLSWHRHRCAPELRAPGEEPCRDAWHDASPVVMRPAGASPWKPIETAPRDETRILGWDGREQFVMFWRGTHHKPHQDKPGWHENIYRRAPTHWKPLDAPPSVSRPNQGTES